MKPQIIGKDGIVRDVRKVRCTTAAAWKKCRKTLAVWYEERGNKEGYAEVNRKIRRELMRAKNAPGRFARSKARQSNETAA